MSDAVIFAIVFAGLFVLRIIAATIIFFYILPQGDRCPNCDAVTVRLVIAAAVGIAGVVGAIVLIAKWAVPSAMQEEVDERYLLQGHLALVTRAIGASAYGEIRYDEGGTTYTLPAALPKVGVIGFCWGGSTTFGFAGHSARVSAAVPYYGGVRSADQLGTPRAPIFAMYGGDDQRVDATIPLVDSLARVRGFTFERRVFPGAGHGFLRQQDGRDGKNLAASREAWPLTLAWFRTHLGA